jgi:hypothetical protein
VLASLPGELVRLHPRQQPVGGPADRVAFSGTYMYVLRP